MNSFISEVIVPVFTIFAAFILVCSALLLPVAWFDGHAKSAYIKQTQGVDIPWYQATFLQVHVNNVNAKVESR